MYRKFIAPSLAFGLLFFGLGLQSNAQFAPVPQGQVASSGPQYNPGGPTWPEVQQPQSQPNYSAPYPQGVADAYGNQLPPPSESQQDIAADRQHGVARLSVADGEVNVRRGDGTGLVAAAINAPLLAQDHLQTAADGRAEVELDYGNVLRVGANTDVGFADLAYRRYQIQLGGGSIIYREIRDSGAQAEIDTPSVGIHPVQPGDYRITVFDDGSTQVTVRSGAADVMSPRGSQSLAPGQSLLVRGNANDPEFQNASPAPFDQLDGWSQERDRPLENAQSYRYVSPDIAGAEDLDANGSWVSSSYGQAWEPNDVGSDWSPYSNGNWSYEPYYGWTWVDAAPWGWAPYHYGRWFMNGSRWCWWPGRGGAGFAWSPAVVGFFGYGGGLGWVPLAPYEAFRPWWGGFGLSIGLHFGGWGGGWRGGAIWNTYRNAGFRGGALYAGAGAFGVRGGRFSTLPRGQLASASFIGARLPVSPSRASYAFSTRAAFANTRSIPTGNRTFFHGTSGFGQRGGAYSNSNRIGSSGFPSHGQAPAVRNESGWHNFGDPGNAARMNFSHTAEANGGWHNFGESQRGVPAHPYATPQGQQRYQPSYGGRSNAGSYSAPQSRGYTNPAQSYRAPSQPQSHYAAPSYQGHDSAPSYQAPHYSAPSYQAPHYNGGGQTPHYSGGGGGGGSQHYSQPHSSAPHGGGGSSHAESHGHSSGGGGHHH